MSKNELEKMDEEAKELGWLSPGSKLYSYVLDAPTKPKKALLYIIPLIISAIIASPNKGFTEAILIYFGTYLLSTLLLPLVRYKKGTFYKIVHVLIAIIFILSLLFIGALFFAVFVIFLGNLIERFGVDSSLVPVIIAIICVISMKIYRWIKKYRSVR